MRTSLTTSLAEAWAARADRARDDLLAASMAPALFKPEFVEQAQHDYTHAVQQSRYWLVVAR